jgi:hypothetical protein
MENLKVKVLAATAVLFLLLLALASILQAQALSPSERQKIEALIKYVGDLKETKFIRNGSSYSAAAAATFLRRKWRANETNVKTARDFIDKVASFSGTSGEPYLIRVKDGKEIKSRDFLAAELQRMEDAPNHPSAAGG